MRRLGVTIAFTVANIREKGFAIGKINIPPPRIAPVFHFQLAKSEDCRNYEWVQKYQKFYVSQNRRIKELFCSFVDNTIFPALSQRKNELGISPEKIRMESPLSLTDTQESPDSIADIVESKHLDNLVPENEENFTQNVFEPFLQDLLPDDDENKNITSLASDNESKLVIGGKDLVDIITRKEKTPRNRKRERRKKDKKIAANEVDGNQKKKRLVNHFVAIQVTDEKVKEQVQDIQHKILSSPLPSGFNVKGNIDLEEDSAIIFKDAMERLESLHFTMGVIGLYGKEEIEKAQQVVERCWMKHKILLEEDPIHLDILGLGHFGNKVIFAKIQNDGHISRLKALADDLREEFDNSNIFQAPTPFQAHMTIAKMSRSRKLHKKKIKSFPREIWTDHELHYFGQQKVESLQLLAMTRDPKTNYYKMIADYKLKLMGTAESDRPGDS